MKAAARRPATKKVCRTILVAFSKYLDGEQTPAACRRIERHLATCTSCAAATDRIRTAVAICRQQRLDRLPESVRRRAAERIRALLGAG